MAATSITRNTMLNLGKTFFPKSPSLLPNSSPKVSRVRFSTSASKYNEGRHAAIDNRDHPASDYAGRAKETANETFDRTRERVEKARERSKDMKDKAKGHARETWHGLRLRRLKCKNISRRVADVLTVRSLKFKFFVKSTDSNTLKRNRDGSVSINEY